MMDLQKRLGQWAIDWAKYFDATSASSPLLSSGALTLDLATASLGIFSDISSSKQPQHRVSDKFFGPTYSRDVMQPLEEKAGSTREQQEVNKKRRLPGQPTLAPEALLLVEDDEKPIVAKPAPQPMQLGTNPTTEDARPAKRLRLDSFDISSDEEEGAGAGGATAEEKAAVVDPPAPDAAPRPAVVDYREEGDPEERVVVVRAKRRFPPRASTRIVRSCWNCGSPDHELLHCPRPRDPAAIAQGRARFQQMKAAAEQETRQIAATATDAKARYFDPSTAASEEAATAPVPRPTIDAPPSSAPPLDIQFIETPEQAEAAAAVDAARRSAPAPPAPGGPAVHPDDIDMDVLLELERGLAGGNAYGAHPDDMQAQQYGYGGNSYAWGGYGGAPYYERAAPTTAPTHLPVMTLKPATTRQPAASAPPYWDAGSAYDCYDRAFSGAPSSRPPPPAVPASAASAPPVPSRRPPPPRQPVLEYDL